MGVEFDMPGGLSGYGGFLLSLAFAGLAGALLGLAFFVSFLVVELRVLRARVLHLEKNAAALLSPGVRVDG